MSFPNIYGPHWANGPMAGNLEAERREKNAKPGISTVMPGDTISCPGPYCKGRVRSKRQFMVAGQIKTLCHRCAGRKPC